MIILIVVASLLFSLLSPFTGYLFVVSINGSLLYSNGFKKSVPFYLFFIIGIIVVFSAEVITVMEVGDILIGVIAASIIFIELLRRKQDYVQALFVTSVVQLVYAVIRYFLFGNIYKERLETFTTGYKELISEAGGISDLAQQDMIFETVVQIMTDYQPAIWAIAMLLAIYLSAVFISKRILPQWQHEKVRFPYILSYVLIISLGLAIIPETRLVGINGTLMLMTFFLIQGMSILDYLAKKHFKNSRFIMIATIVLLIVNVFFALAVAVVGLFDYWLDIRKLNK